mgnify:CR=1 FL=1
MAYLVEFSCEAIADLEALAPIIQERILRKVRWLSDNFENVSMKYFVCREKHIFHKHNIPSSFQVDDSKTFHVFIVDFFTINWVFLCWAIRPQTWSFWGILHYRKLFSICFLYISFCFLRSSITKLLRVCKTCTLN